MRIVVAPNGEGDFPTVQAAVDAAPSGSREPVVIDIKNGVYEEKLTVPKEKCRLHFIGESRDGVVLTYSDRAKTIGTDGEPLGTFRSASAFFHGDDFTAERLTIRNGSGQGAGQAVAAFVTGDRAVFREVTFLGFQDTLYTGESRQYYESCRIEGDVDFIFGPASAVFSHCEIHCKRKGGYLTAASTPEHQEHGYVFLDCKVTSDPGASDVYLGRPWRPHARVVWIRTEMDGSIKPEGWHNWNDPARERTSRYGEYASRGDGANPEARVGWSGRLTEEEARECTAEKVLGGPDGWNPAAASPHA
ncbi:pectinesterase family protein [Paenibacillus doosanensis]|uniref:Pectinesterase n=1 Tax=Paenibacillus konkukensis TaxID=2020716 RepID=A0ABY4RWP9_9BACL|nr:MULTISPECIES: pectinesterase family protein [Paenibacillus]MCS7458665.1 pectinesterase family protein [Paenibacillus doosanensis]UQZ86811.1 Pectinesterase A precursor [Paenibacillus konkukensis]